jgi:serine-type D-Ala-D-Ala carboxypeptidase (penicillin-binding protein 5/6)
MRTVLITILTAAFTLAAVAQNPEPYTAALVLEPTTGQVLYAKNPDQPFPTASMIKMMTLLVVMDHVKSGHISLETPVTVSAKSSKMGGSQVYLRHGEVFTVRDLIAATMVHSANDAAVSLAEAVSGTDQAFVIEMREKAQELGLTNTNIHSPHGLPPSPGAQTDTMSPADLAKVGIEVMKDPLLAELATVQTMPFRGGVFTMYNPNRLLKMYPHATGIKTGFTVAAGFCVTASAKRGDMELIAVVMGSQRKNDNFESAAKLFSEAFAQYQMVPLVKKGTVMTTHASVKGGAADSVRVVAGEDVKLLLKKGDAKNVSLAFSSSGAEAPIRQFQQVGTILVKQGDQTLQQVPALALAEVPKQSLWKRLMPF